MFTGNTELNSLWPCGDDPTNILLAKGEDCVLKSEEDFKETGKRCTDTAVKIQTKFKFYKAVSGSGGRKSCRRQSP